MDLRLWDLSRALSPLLSPMSAPCFGPSSPQATTSQQSPGVEVDTRPEFFQNYSNQLVCIEAFDFYQA